LCVTNLLHNQLEGQGTHDVILRRVRVTIVTVEKLNVSDEFEVSKYMHHHTFQINHPTRCNTFPSLLLDIYVQLNMYRASSRPSSGAQQTFIKKATGFGYKSKAIIRAKLQDRKKWRGSQL